MLSKPPFTDHISPPRQPVTDSLHHLLPIAIRLLVWGVLFGILYILRGFFLLLFLTFVFAYIQSRGVDRLEGSIKNRPLRVVLVAALFLGVLISTGLFLIPKAQAQAKLFANQFGTYVARVDEEIIAMAQTYGMIQNIVNELQQADNLKTHENGQIGPSNSITMALIQTLVSPEDSRKSGDNLRHAVDTIRNIGSHLLAIGSAFFLALILSFLIVLDLPRLGQGIHNIQHTKLRFIYDEVADNILGFSRVLGKALEAQLLIACANTALTAIGMLFLGLNANIAFLSMIVFLCSFVPVAGVFLSSIPICLVALQTSGLQGVILVIMLITMIHMIEGYVLNPRIYGLHLRINPVIVLIILTIAGKLFYVWGLILGVPVCCYFFEYAIREQTPDTRAATLKKV